MSNVDHVRPSFARDAKRPLTASRGGGDQRTLKTWMTGSVPFPYCCDT